MSAPGGPEAATVVRKLLAAGYISSHEIVRGRLALHDLSRSNTVFLVEVDEQPRCLVKHGVQSERADNADLARERAICMTLGCQEGSGWQPAPRWLGDVDDLLILEALSPGESLEERQAREGTHRVLGSLFGEALGGWHRRGSDLELSLPERAPWVMSSLAAEPPEFLWTNPPVKELIVRLRSDDALRDGLAALKARWRPERPLHGDVRWNNALITRRHGLEQVVLVDWEFAQMGEPAWDLAAAASEALIAELLIERSANGRYEAPDASELSALIGGVAGYLGGLGHGYRTGFEDESACEILRASADFVAARLVHNAFQHAIWDPHSGMSQALLIGGLASSLFRHPQVVTAALFDGGRAPALAARAEGPP